MLASPIGNLQDASPRLKSLLKNCDAIAAEDTRVTARLLAGLDISGKRVVSVREHNEKAAASKLLAQHPNGRLAYLSDAGTPCVSDPGALLVNTFRSAGFKVISVPGPSAVTAAMSAAGMQSQGFVFAGFLPRTGKDFAARLNELAQTGLPIVLFEAPTRVKTSVARIAESFGGASLCVCRELSKIHEQIIAGTAEEIQARFEDGTIPTKGEFTLVLRPPSKPATSLDARKTATLLASELPLAKAVKLAAKLVPGTKARELYRSMADMNKDDC